MRQKKIKKSSISEVAVYNESNIPTRKINTSTLGIQSFTGSNTISTVGAQFLTGTGLGIGTTTTTNITLNPSNLQWGNLCVSMDKMCDLKSLIAEKKISLKSFIRENSYDLFDVKKIKLKRHGVELECVKKIDTNEIDSLNSKSSLISEIIDVNIKSDIRKSAINKSETFLGFSSTDSLSFTYLGGGNTLTMHPGTITIAGGYNNIAVGTPNGITYSH